MAAQIVAATDWAFTTTNFTPTIPVGTQIGDLLLLTIASKYRVSAPDVSPPLAWTLHDFFNTGAVTEAGVENTGDIGVAVYYRYYDGTDPGAISVDGTPNVVGYRCNVIRSDRGRNIHFRTGDVLPDTSADTTVTQTLFSVNVASDDLVLGTIAVNKTDVSFSGDVSLSMAGATFNTTTATDSSTSLGTNLLVRDYASRVTASDRATNNLTYSQTVAGTTTGLMAALSCYVIYELEEPTTTGFGIGALITGTGGSFTPNSTAKMLGDVRFLHCFYKPEGVTITPPTGWTLLEQIETTGYADIGGEDAGDLGVAIYYRVEDGVNEAWSVGASGFFRHVEHSWRPTYRGGILLFDADSVNDTDGNATISGSVSGIIAKVGHIIRVLVHANQSVLSFPTTNSPTQAGATFEMTRVRSTSSSTFGTNHEYVFYDNRVLTGPGSGDLSVSVLCTGSTADLRANVVVFDLWDSIVEVEGGATSTLPGFTQTSTGQTTKPVKVVTSTASTATAYSNQRKVDRCQNGVLWATHHGGGNELVFFYSTDDGITWTKDTSFIDVGSVNNYEGGGGGSASLFIDLDDYAHVVYRNRSDGWVYYRRGTPNAGRTSWTWSAATAFEANSNSSYPDVVVHREGTGWVAHIVTGYGAAGSTAYNTMTIANNGTVTPGSRTLIGSGYAGSFFSYPSIDFNHTGDGKTVAGGTPHLYAAWSAGTTGAGKGIRFKKATYSGGTWTWGTEREIDNTQYVSGTKWLNCLFDGTRVILAGMLSGGATPNKTVLFERDAADTTTTTHVDQLLEIFAGSASYDSDGNIYWIGGLYSSPTPSLRYQKWTRSTLTLETPVDVDTSNINALEVYASAKRGYSNGRIEFIYTDGTASPYNVKYSYVGDEPELFPAVITTSSAVTATAYSNQRKVDRCQNGVLWSIYWNGLGGSTNGTGTPMHLRYSTNDGVTWTDGGGFDFANSGTTYTPNGSFFIDLDDYAHVVYKDRHNGYVYYRRGTPNAGRTAWTWSSATTVTTNVSVDYPDLVVHREGTGWEVHIVASFQSGASNQANYYPFAITSTGTITPRQAIAFTNHGVAVATYPSIDFNHAGDGKTVAGGTPHLYVAWSAGTTGAGKGIRFRKATYSGGSWTWGTEREIDSTRYVSGAFQHINCLFDGTRVIIAGSLQDDSSGRDLLLYERDAADTATITRVLLDNFAAAVSLYYGTTTYDSSGNVYTIGLRSGDNLPHYYLWNRAGNSLSASIPAGGSPIGSGAGYFSAKRGYSNGGIEFIYTDGVSSPYNVTYNLIAANSSTGTASQTLPKFSQAAVGRVPTIGTANSVLPKFSQSAAGTHADPVDTGTAASTLPKFTQAASGTHTDPVDTGTIASTLPKFSQAATGSTERYFTGTASSALRPFTQAAVGRVHDKATVASVLPKFIQSASGIVFPVGTPTNLQATAVSGSRIDLTWTAVAGVDGYDIERDGSVIAYGHPTNSFSDTGLAPDVEYDYRVRAVI